MSAHTALDCTAAGKKAAQDVGHLALHAFFPSTIKLTLRGTCRTLRAVPYSHARGKRNLTFSFWSAVVSTYAQNDVGCNNTVGICMTCYVALVTACCGMHGSTGTKGSSLYRRQTRAVTLSYAVMQ
jgi:hypothetical protein